MQRQRKTWCSVTALLVAALLAPAALAKGEAPRSGPSPGSVLLYHLAVPNHVVIREAVVEERRLGQTRLILLKDDGSASGDTPYDGVYVGEGQGPFAHLVGLRLLVAVPGSTLQVVYEGLERITDARRHRVGWSLTLEGPGRTLGARPTVTPLPGRAGRIMALAPTMMAFGWGVVVLGAVALVMRKKQKAPGS